MRSNSKIPFLLGPGLEIPVSVYVLVRERTKPTSLKLDAATNEIVERTAYFSTKERAQSEERQSGDEQQNAENIPERLSVNQVRDFSLRFNLII
jgi:hypothetical protein